MNAYRGRPPPHLRPWWKRVPLAVGFYVFSFRFYVGMTVGCILAGASLHARHEPAPAPPKIVVKREEIKDPQAAQAYWFECQKTVKTEYCTERMQQLHGTLALYVSVGDTELPCAAGMAHEWLTACRRAGWSPAKEGAK